MPAAAPARAATGLTSAEAVARLKADGPNELPSAASRNVLRVVADVLRQPMFALLCAGGVVYLLLGDRVEAVLLLAFALLSATIEIVQESRSERVLESLRNLASPRACVIRDGRRTWVAGREVVVGDLIVVGEGDRIAADATLVDGDEVLVDESLLTGESVPVRKLPRAAATVPSVAAPGGENLPYIYAGALVVRGSGHAVVHATGARSEIGKIGHDLRTIETEQPRLQRQLQWLVRDFSIVGAIAGTLVVVLFGLLRGSWLQAMLGGIALGMSMLPQEFPLIMAVFMAMGAWRISRARVLTRRAAAIETLGATTVLCTDKTGTLTENRMTVAAVVADGERWDPAAGGGPSPAIARTVEAALHAFPADPVDPMDVAIHAVAARHLPASVHAHFGRDVTRSYGLRPDLFAVATVALDEDGSHTAYAKGAVEAIAELSRMPAARLAEVRAQADGLAAAGIRVLGVARSVAGTVPAAADLPESHRDLAFEYLGLIGFTDPLRADVPAAVAECRAAGIRVVMITGDYPATARAIARQAGLDAEKVLTGDEIDALSDERLTAALKTTSIFARIRPNQKLRLVQCLKAAGEVVAMTGDGVNDAPAIKAAHIGIAMGARGTDVAREAAAIVLLDDDFGSMVQTVRLGRRIYDNLRKAIEFIVAVHVPIAGLALLPLLLGLPLMLSPAHIAFLEMIIDPACSVVFEAEREEDDVMRRPPRATDSPLLLPRRILWAAFQGLFVLVVLAVLLVVAAHAGLAEPRLRAIVFTALVMTIAGVIIVNRSFDTSPWRALLRPNRWLWVLLGGVAALLTLIVAWPPARDLFRFGELHWHDIVPAAGAALASLVALDVFKRFWFRRAAAQSALPVTGRQVEAPPPGRR